MRFEEIPALAAVVWDGTSLAQIESRWREKELGYREMLVAELDGRLVGTVSIHQPQDDPKSLHLFAFDVGPEWRNKGIGRAMVEHVLEEGRRRGVRRVYLEVRTDNPARRLYQRAGFRRVGGMFINRWWKYGDEGGRERIEEESVRMVRRVGSAGKARDRGRTATLPAGMLE